MVINENTIKADEGMVLTDGKAFGNIVYLGKYDSVDNWHEITEEEAERLQSIETPTEEEVTEADYISALEDLGVKFNE
ncbi:MAG: hypothetical protein J6Q39_08265 [Bacteroidales bacterium]|nr:hypothetical protein [Bacteroidales bacterium]